MPEQPIDQLLRDCRRILVAGAGGGYDVFGGLPLFFELRAAGKSVHLASLSFSYLNGLDGAEQNVEHPCLYAVTGNAATPDAYCPEAWLSRWLETTHGYTEPVWSFDKVGVRPLREAYRFLVQTLSLDAIVLVDGGVDALARGDESSLGTPAEDLAALCAVASLDVPVRVLCCVAFGAELRDGICHAQVLERVAELSRGGAWLGASALLAQSSSVKLYQEAVEFVFENQSRQRRSHIQKVLLASLRGEFGEQGPHVWISPLMSLCWFFDLPSVARTHLFLEQLEATESIWDVTALVRACQKSVKVRDRNSIPI